jgi:general secretion pathway protein D
VLFAAGCAMPEKPFIPAPLVKPRREAIEPGAAGAGQPATEAEPRGQPETAFYQTPKPPASVRSSAGRAPSAPAAAADEGKPLDASVALENIPLPQFVQTVFAITLKRNISMDAQVQSRTDLVSLRTGKPQTDAQLFAVARAVLRSYGIAVTEFDGLVRITPDNAQSGYLPEIRRGRALPEVPAGLRPVFFLKEVEHTNASFAVGWIRSLFQGRVTATEDTARNGLLLSGQSDTVAAALEVIELLDQPMMRGRLSVRIAPVFWSADELARRLVDLLMAEGYFVAQNPSANTPILIMPIAPANSIIVFAANEQMLNHTLRWARELDQPAKTRAGASGYVTYYVRNTDAADLAKTLNEVITGAAAPAVAAGTPGAPPARGGNRVVINAASNSLIFQASSADYQQWYGLLQELDRPPRSALVMATVAEVRLTDNQQFGFQWMLNQFVSHGYTVNAATGAAPGATSNTPYISLANMIGNPRALLTLLANTNKIRILSNPSIMARNGETATIQVGQEVPILTSQVSSANTGTIGGTTGILQSIQYRNTGVILKVKPVVHSGGRINLDVAQEVSAAQANETGVNASPIILTRKVDTRLTVADGGTVLLGGLMQEQRTSGNAGVPLLKDIPVIGGLFQTSNSDATERTELVILLTCYVVEDDFDSRSISEAFRAQFSWAARIPDAGLGAAAAAAAKMPAAATQERAAPVQTPAPPVAPQDADMPVPRRSMPYVVPDESVQSPSFVVPKQQTMDSLAPPADSQLTPAVSPMLDSPKPAIGQAGRQAGGAVAPATGKAVTDEKLKQELLDAIRRSPGGQAR